MELMLLNCDIREDSWECLGQQGDESSQSWRKSVLNIHWKDWCWSWNSNTLANAKNWLIWKDPEVGKIEGRRKGGWQRMRWLDGITNLIDMSLSEFQEFVMDRKCGLLQSMGFQRVRHDSATELTEWWIWGIFQVYESPQVSGGGSR